MRSGSSRAAKGVRLRTGFDHPLREVIVRSSGTPYAVLSTGAHVIEVSGLTFVLLASGALAIGAARAVLGVLLFAMRVAAVRSASRSLLRPAAYSARRFGSLQDSLTSHDGVGPLVAREAA